MDLFEPTFGDTKEYKSIREIADTAVSSVQYLNKVFGNISNSTENKEMIVANSKANDPLYKINMVLDSAVESAGVKGEPIDPFNL